VNVIGVIALCRAYVINSSTGFDLLLSRSWMHRVKCIYNYSTRVVTIRASSSALIIIAGIKLNAAEARVP